MQRRTALHAAAAALAATAWPSHAALPAVEVFKTPTCGCCNAWVEHLRTAGFTVRTQDVPDTAPVRQRLGMPQALGSCHTARVGGYVLEGHVPASDIRRLLASGIQALGLAVPGMPIGSPGMEQGPRMDPYEVLLVEHSGRTRVFARHPQS
ncbi:DUF411 domain-containing protein [Pseudorhodoferax sp.]|uniref:DUF411 domain-containing protein n=1 Tax=Pseudorhodoferax sp. TaxID=1993553 RepID=UPI0039E35F44